MQLPEGGVRSLELELPADVTHPMVGAGNRTLVLRKSSLAQCVIFKRPSGS